MSTENRQLHAEEPRSGGTDPDPGQTGQQLAAERRFQLD